MDKNKIVMIAPVAVAAILMLGILAAAGNAQESSNTSSSQESSKTGNGATSPTSSQETSNGKKPTKLTISVSQKGPVYTEYGSTWIPLTISGRLTSEGSGVAGASIALNSEEEIGDVKTDNAGYYHDTGSYHDHKIKHEISAWTRELPSEYNESSASTTFKGSGNVAQGTSQKASITGNAVQGASNTGQGSPAKKPTEITISATPSGPAKTEENNKTKETLTWVPVTLSGRLTSEGSGVAGATVALYCNDSPCDREPPSGGGSTLAYADTDSGGHYSIGVVLEDHNHKTYKIQAFTQHIPSEGYEYSNETTTIQLR